MEFYETVEGKKYEQDVPQLIQQLSRIADSLEKLAEEKVQKDCPNLQQVANEISEYEPAIARLLMEYIK